MTSELVVTGARGWVGRHVVPLLAERYAIRALDIEDCDITDLDALTSSFVGADALLHLPGIAGDRDVEREIVPKNVIGCFNAFEAAHRAGLGSVVFASSGQVVLNNPPDVVVSVEMPIRPTGPYAASKVFGEALARHYHDDHAMRAFCLRMGWFGPAFTDEMRNDDVGWCWLSPADLASVVIACLSSDETFGLFLVASCRAVGHWDLSNTVGWEPHDQP